MVKKIFPLWADEKEIDLLKLKAKSSKQSISQFILKKSLGKKRKKK